MRTQELKNAAFASVSTPVSNEYRSDPLKRMFPRKHEPVSDEIVKHVESLVGKPIPSRIGGVVTAQALCSVLRRWARAELRKMTADT